MKEDGICPSCGGPASIKPLRDYPVVAQIVFGVSFLAFLFFYDQIQTHRPLLWAWTAFQILTGAALVRGRILSKKRVLRCVRCGTDLR